MKPHRQQMWHSVTKSFEGFWRKWKLLTYVHVYITWTFKSYEILQTLKPTLQLLQGCLILSCDILGLIIRQYIVERIAPTCCCWTLLYKSITKIVLSFDKGAIFDIYTHHHGRGWAHLLICYSRLGDTKLPISWGLCGGVPWAQPAGALEWCHSKDHLLKWTWWPPFPSSTCKCYHLNPCLWHR